MKLLTCVFGVIAALAIVVTATGQEKDKETIKRRTLTILLFDADTKGIAKGIKQIDIPEEKVAKRVCLADAVEPPFMVGNNPFKRALGGKEITDPKREWVVKPVKMTLADDTVVESQILALKDTGKTTIKLDGPPDSVKVIDVNGLGKFTSDKGKRTWYVYLAQYEETVVIPKRGQEEKKETVKRQALTILLFDADTKGIAKGINQIEFPEEKVAKKVRLANAIATPPPAGWDDFFKRALGGTEITDPKREWVMKSVKMTLADDTVVDAQLLSLRDTGNTTINLKRPLNDQVDGRTKPLIVNGLPTLTSDKGKRTWYVYMTPYEETLVIPKRKKP